MKVDIHFTDLKQGIRQIELRGRLDENGVDAIKEKFADCCAGESMRLIVDLSEVTFLASQGIRLLTGNAKAVTARGGKMVILNPSSEVHDLLELAGIPATIPIYSHLESAETILLAA